MRKARWLANWQYSTSKPVIYHCISRVVDRRFVFGERECEAFRMYLRMMGSALGKKPGRAVVSQSAKGPGQATKNTAELLESKDNETVLKDLGMSKMLRSRIRYFTDGAVIGSKEFVNEAFASARDRFGPKRKDGAIKLKGHGASTGEALWSLRDLRNSIA